MLSKNLKYYRLKNNISKKELASLVGVSPMAISHYENGERKPGMETIKAMAEALGVRVTDFLSDRNHDLNVLHGEFRKQSKLSVKQQEYIRESVEEYMSRFFSVVDILGGEILPDAPICHGLEVVGETEEDALAMRKYLHIAEFGPIGNLIELLENKGILIYVCNIESDAFSGMNGLVNERPFIIVNGNMSPERIRSTIAHEMAHFIFSWPKELGDREIEDMATAISGAFLFSAEDAKRELGIRRRSVTRDMNLICKEYGISMYLLVKRASLCNIINSNAATEFYIMAGKAGWKRNEPVRISREEPTLFAQLVYRAVSENEISLQKGAELLQQSLDHVAEHCFVEEG